MGEVACGDKAGLVCAAHDDVARCTASTNGEQQKGLQPACAGLGASETFWGPRGTINSSECKTKINDHGDNVFKVSMTSMMMIITTMVMMITMKMMNYDGNNSKCEDSDMQSIL